jgi:hypothetical protein
VSRQYTHISTEALKHAAAKLPDVTRQIAGQIQFAPLNNYGRATSEVFLLANVIPARG